MLGSVGLIARTVQGDLERLRVRTVTATVCYLAAGLVFAAAALLAGAAGIIVLVEEFGQVAGLAIGAVVLVVVGVLALAVNAVLRLRSDRLKRQSAAIRSAAIANTAAAGAETAQNATPSLLPAAAILAFALTNVLLRPRGDR